jgi:hypothetical protein
MQNWEQWFAAEQQQWDPNSKQAGSVPHLRIPQSFHNRRTPSSIFEDLHSVVEDSALQDLDDAVEFVTHDSGVHGHFSRTQRQDLTRQLLFQEQMLKDSGPILEKCACIYSYTFPDSNQKFNEQIGVGLVTKIHGDPSSEDCLLDIQFCPPSGALPQTSKRPDTLYQNIEASMKFKLNHKISKGPRGKKVRMLDIEKMQPRSVLLAYNLELNKSGKFSNSRVAAGKHSYTSMEVAKAVISEYYADRCASQK